MVAGLLAAGAAIAAVAALLSWDLAGDVLIGEERWPMERSALISGAIAVVLAGAAATTWRWPGIRRRLRDDVALLREAKAHDRRGRAAP